MSIGDRMPKGSLTVSELLDSLEKFYGAQKPNWPTDPYEAIIWGQCGYPATDANCLAGWDRLKRDAGIEPGTLIRVPVRTVTQALKAGGVFPGLRATRLKKIAWRIENKFRGDLRSALCGDPLDALQILSSFPDMTEARSERILLFAGIVAFPAVPTKFSHVLLRVFYGRERENALINYAKSQQLVASEVPETFATRTRAYLLLKHHGGLICGRKNPACEICPVAPKCAFCHGRSHHCKTKSTSAIDSA
jgi:adenine-specific DNA glycosylase